MMLLLGDDIRENKFYFNDFYLMLIRFIILRYN